MKEQVLGIHECTQYMRFISPEFTDRDLNDSLLKLKAKQKSSFDNLSEAYITIQPSAANNNAPYKTWDQEKWKEVIDVLVEKSPLSLLILGDESELAFGDSLPQSDKIINLIGNTELQDLPAILEGAAIHVGHDSGLMHIAGCVGTETVTVWGGSDPELFGWKKINQNKHHILHEKLPCHPCNRWIEPNSTKVEVPTLCPDFACLKAISGSMLVDKVIEFIKD